MATESNASARILRILLAESGVTPSPGLNPEELVRLTLDAPGLGEGLPKGLEDAVDAALAQTNAALASYNRDTTDTTEPS